MSTPGFFRDAPAEAPANLLPGQRPAWIGKRETDIGEAMLEGMKDAAKDKPYFDLVLYRNTSDTYRENVQGDLYVSRAPHQVRPFSHTGVTYDLNGPEGISLGLNNPIERPEYERKSVRFRSGHQVCLQCRDMLNYYCKYREVRSSWDRDKDSFEEDDDRSVLALSNAVVHHFNLLSILVSVEIDQCYLCEYVQQRIDHGFDISPDRLEDFRLECCWHQIVENPSQGDTIYFVMYNPSQEKELVWNWRNLLRLRLWPKDIFGHHFARSVYPEDLDDDFFENVIDDDFACNDKPITRALARGWLASCDLNEDGKHNECNREHDDFLPTRLLDVQHAIKTSQLRLVCPHSGNSPSASRRYATLSHCWGSWGASMNPVLTTSNLEERQEVGLDLTSVPQTFIDAVEVAHWFNIDWLWIDCLCIIQNSKEDWMREARMMDQIYRNAEVNISSDFGHDSRSGLFVHRDYTAIAPLRIEATKPQKILYAIPEETTFAWMHDARSLTRAWIHRERQLARRLLHFTSKELVWECCGVEKSSFASESFPGGAPFKGLFNGDTKFQSGRLHKPLAPMSEETYGVWNDLCERLSDKNVTHPTDMPIILSSMAKEFHQLLPEDEYLAGLWKSQMPHALLWRTKSYGADKHKIYADNHDRSYVAPSWSWLSVSVPVSLALKTPSSHNIPLATVLAADVRLSYDDPYGPVRFGALHLEGFLRQIQLDFNDDGRTFDLSVVDDELQADGSEGLRYIGSNWDDYEGNMCSLELDARPETLPLRCYCLFTTITEWAQNLDDNYRNISCLLLQAVGDGSIVVSEHHATAVYKRVGMLTLEDLYSFKMRYAVADGNEENGNGEEDASLDESTSGTDDEAADNAVTAQDADRNKNDDSEKAQDSDKEGSSRSGMEDNGDRDFWMVYAEFLRLVRWRVIKAAKEEKKSLRREAGKEEQAKEDNMNTELDVYSVNEYVHITAGKQESEGIYDSKTAVVDEAATEPDVTSKSDHNEQFARYQQRADSGETETMSASAHTDVAEDASVLGVDEAEPSKLDYGTLNSSTPAWGQELSPLEALYQFDDILDTIKKEAGRLLWMKKLQTTKLIVV